ncbi:MAG: tetratricopeptide repeat protein, partial [Planctomycetota bacterium]
MRRLLLSLLVISTALLGAHLLAEEKLRPDELLKLGDTYFREKTFKKAIDAYERLLRSAPDHPRTLHAKIRIGRSYLGLRQWWQAMERLKPLHAETEKGSVARAEVAHLLGATAGRHWGGSKEVVGWLDEAVAVYAAKGREEERTAALFDLGYALAYSWNYNIRYDDWQKEHYREDPEKIEVSWNDYRLRRMEEADRTRYDRTVATYRRIVEFAGGKGHDAARARYMLGAFHVNVLAGAFRVNASYYGGLVGEEAEEKQREALAKYVEEVRKGIGVWREILEHHPDDALADDARYLIALTLHRRLNEFVEALTEYKALLAEAPRSDWANSARMAVQEIEKEDVFLSVPKPFLPGARPKIHFAARNVTKVSFTAYRLDLAELLRGRYRFHKVDGVDVSGLSPVASWEVETGVADDRKGVQQELELPLTAPGAYLVHADGRRRTCRTLVVISDLGVVVKSARDRVLLYGTDAVTGEPRPGVRYVMKATWRWNRLSRSKVFTAASSEDGIAEIDVTGLAT